MRKDPLSDQLTQHPAARPGQRTLCKNFNEFLGLHACDQAFLRRYRDALHEGADEFAAKFYDYLLSYPATAAVLKNYQAQGGNIGELADKQLARLSGFLTGDVGETSAQRLAHVGKIHYRNAIEPVWMMGAYLLYLTHLRKRIRENSTIEGREREALDLSITKLLFRDMGLMLQGYWDASVEALHDEREKVFTLQTQITGLLSNISQLLWSVDVVNNRALFVSPTAGEICQGEPDMPIPGLSRTLSEDREAVRRAWENTLQGQKTEIESRVPCAIGEPRWFRRVFYPYTNAAGQVVRIDGVMEDMTDAKATMERLHFLATTDNLTGLTNRTLFHDRLGQAIAAARRAEGKYVILMIIDLNHFKEINDTLGHKAGDAVLIEVARRLQSALRDSDTLARLGGDEFAVVLPNVKNARRTGEKVANKILRALLPPVKYEENELYVGGAVGVAVYPEHGDDTTTLMSRVDVAMYRSKSENEGYRFYDPTFDPNTVRRLQLPGELRRALTQNEFALYYQPKIDMHRDAVTGVEALIRWRHPQRGLLTAQEFIPLAERSYLINSVTDWVLRAAVGACRSWREAGYLLRVSVNVPGRIFYDPEIADKLQDVLHSYGVPGKCLELEVTEDILKSDVEHLSRVLERIHAMGVSITIDNFGTGCASLSHLEKLPLQAFKIDKSLVQEMRRDEQSATIVRSIIGLAHDFGREAMAEGIENRQTWDTLANLGCDSAQGYYICKPLPPQHLTDWLAGSRWSGRA